MINRLEQEILSSQPVGFWKLNETSGTTAENSADKIKNYVLDPRGTGTSNWSHDSTGVTGVARTAVTSDPDEPYCQQLAGTGDVGSEYILICNDISDLIPVTVGEDVFFTIKAKLVSGSGTLRIAYLEYDDSGAYLGYSTSSAVSGSDNAWHTLSKTNTTNSGVAYIRIGAYVDISSGPATYQLRATKAVATPCPVEFFKTGFFDGNSDGCVWDGATNASTTTRVLDGTYVNTPSLGQPGFIFGGDSAVGFNGVSGGTANYVSVPFSSFGPPSGFSFECWVYLDSIPDRIYLMRGENSDEPSVYIDSDGSLNLAYYNGTLLATSTVSVNTGQWNHIAFVKGNYDYIYLNGENVTDPILGFSIFDEFAGNMLFGTLRGGASNTPGLMQYVVFYNERLSDETIALHYDIGYNPVVTSEVPHTVDSYSPNWIFRLADTKTFEDIIEITQARNKQLQLYLNKPGSLTFDLPLEEAQTREFFVVQTCIKAYRNGELVWSGPVWTINDDASSNKTQIGCVGWFEFFNKRSILEELQYADIDAGAIAFDLYKQSKDEFAESQYTATSFGLGALSTNWSLTDTDDNYFEATNSPFTANTGFYPYCDLVGEDLVAGEYYQINIRVTANGSNASQSKRYISLSLKDTGTSSTLFVERQTEVDANIVPVYPYTGDFEEVWTFEKKYKALNNILASDLSLQMIVQMIHEVSVAVTWTARINVYKIGRIDDIPITEGVAELTQPRTKTYPKFSNVGQEITNLSEIEAGFDFEIHPKQRTLDIYEKIGTDRDVVFGYNWGPDNLKNVTVNTDAARMVNRFIAVGQSNWTKADEEDKRRLYGLFDEVGSAPNTNESIVLGAYANAEVALRSDPVQTYQIEPYPTGPPGVPAPIEDYGIGDTVFFTAKRGNIEIKNQAVRIFGMSINIDDNGVESVNSIQTLASG